MLGYYEIKCYNAKCMEPSMENIKMMIPIKKDFNEENYNALLYVARPPIPVNILEKAKEFNLKEKPEFHLSVIASKNGKIISDFLATSSISEEIKNQIKNDFLNRKWEYELLPEYFLMEKYYDQNELDKSGYKDMPMHSRYTLIQNAKMNELEEYYKKLSKLTGINFDQPLAHITLFSGSDYAPMENRGIGIYSEEDFEKYLKAKI